MLIRFLLSEVLAIRIYNCKNMCFPDTLMVDTIKITFAGPDISQELVDLLQKRLDNDTLQQLVGLFARNPMFKLMPEDVKVSVKANQPPKIARGVASYDFDISVLLLLREQLFVR